MTSRPRLAASLVAGAVVLLFFAPILGGACLVGGDFSACFEPFAVALAEGARRGDVLRTPLLYGGLPLLAHPVVAGAYPPQYLVALIEPARALSILALVHLAIAAAGTGALLARPGRSVAAAIAGGVVVGLAGVAASSLLQFNLLKGLAWVPWVLLLAGDALRPGARRGAGRLAALAMMTALLLLSTEPFVVLPAAVAVAAVLLPAREDWRGGLRRAIVPVAAMSAGTLLALVLLAPGILYARTSLRAAGFLPEVASQWSLHPAQSLGMIAPRAFGDPRLAGLDGFAARDLLPGRLNEYFASSYLGVLALALALAGAIAGARRERLAAAALGILVLLALGTHGPVQPLLDHFEVDWIRYPVKWLLPALLPLAVLVAAGVDAVVAEGRAGNAARAIVLAGAALGAAVAGLSAPLSRVVASWAPEETGPRSLAVITEHSRQGLLAGGTWTALVALLALVMVAALRRRGRAAHAAPVVVMLLALDLGSQARRSIELAPAEFHRQRSAMELAVLAEPLRQKTWVDATSTLEHPKVNPPRTLREVIRGHRDLMMFYGPAAAGIELALPVDVDGLSPLRQHHLAEALSGAEWRERLMLLGAAGVTHVITMDAEHGGDLVIPAAEVDVGARAPLRLSRNRLALPRARVVPEFRLHRGSEDFMSILRNGPIDLFARATLVAEQDWLGPEEMRPPPPPSQDWKAAARVVFESAGRIDVRTEGDGGVLVVSDAWLPGFRATLDGAPVPVFRADHAFLGVMLPPGEHVVSLQYSPWRG